MKEITSQPRFTFNTIGLFTNDNKATVEFYTKAFGFTAAWDGVQPNVEIFLGKNRIILYPRSAFEQMVSKKFQYPEGLNGTMELSFDVPSLADVDKEYQNALNCRGPDGGRGGGLRRSSGRRRRLHAGSPRSSCGGGRIRWGPRP